MLPCSLNSSRNRTRRSHIMHSHFVVAQRVVIIHRVGAEPLFHDGTVCGIALQPSLPVLWGGSMNTTSHPACAAGT